MHGQTANDALDGGQRLALQLRGEVIVELSLRVARSPNSLSRSPGSGRASRTPGSAAACANSTGAASLGAWAPFAMEGTGVEERGAFLFLVFEMEHLMGFFLDV